MKWDTIKGRIVKRFYRTTIADGSLPLYGYIANNGAGHFNWTISADPDGEMGESNPRAEGGAPTLAFAKEAVRNEAIKYVVALANSIGLVVDIL